MDTKFQHCSALHDVSQSKCAFVVAAESRYGTCDQIECGCKSEADCASQECVNSPCFHHAGFCWACQNYFCRSSDNKCETCLSQHLSAGPCYEAIVKVPLAELISNLHSARDKDLEAFVKYNSDGLGNPLPTDVVTNLGLAVLYAKDLIPDLKQELVAARNNRTRDQKTERQRMRRAAKRLGMELPPRGRTAYISLARYRNSTVHIAAGALLVRHWTRTWHYREQRAILDIMGLSKGKDFVRDRLDYLHTKDPEVYARLDALTARVLPHRH